jgi:hypothetical protein
VTRQPLAPTLQPDRAALTEQEFPAPGGGKVGLAGKVLLAGSCSTGLPETCTETGTEQVTQQPLAPTL